MEPKDVAYDVCRYYVHDQSDVDSGLVSLIDGYRRSRNLPELASCSRHFDWHLHSVREWRFLRQVEAFFKKNSAFSDPEKCHATAEASFWEAEAKCAGTNLALEFYYSKQDLLDPDLRFGMQRVERYIRDVLGEFRSFLDDLPHLVRVTPGATAHSARRNSLPQMKMRMKVYATHGSGTYLRALYRYYGFGTPRVRDCETNRMELVPKNWKTDRTIACEPEGTLPLQLAFDAYAKRRLRRYRIDLSDQTANQRLARSSSVDGKYVTVDFKAASDTISYNAVAWCFPPDWFDYLCRVRSSSFRGCFGEGKYHKFSSMGNGCTFTIETLIFAAACHAVGSRTFQVYGDDVIIEKEYYEAFLRLTRFLGFTINQDKTFTEGPFRESCGVDVFGGIDVTPVYIRSVDRRKASVCHLVNTLGCLTFPGSKLGDYLASLVKQYKLPLVPFSESTMAGVWIDPSVARGLKILRRRRYIDRYKAFIPKNEDRVFVDSRGYYLWFLNKNSQVLFSGPWHLARATRQSETSSAPIFEHKYVRKWVCWHPPTEAEPVHLYWWTELISRCNGRKPE